MLYGVWSAMSAADMKFDGTRLAAGVISGVGFLAAGTIIGVALGAGYYEGGITATVLVE